MSWRVDPEVAGRLGEHEPPVVSARSWDAMSDSLWEGLHQLPGPRIVILWPNARVMAHEAPAEHELALQVLDDVAAGLADERATLGTPKLLSVVVES